VIVIKNYLMAFIIYSVMSGIFSYKQEISLDRVLHVTGDEWAAFSKRAEFLWACIMVIAHLTKLWADMNAVFSQGRICARSVQVQCYGIVKLCLLSQWYR